MGRMRVYHRHDVRTHFINEKMHRHFAGRLLGSADLFDLHVDGDHLVGFYTTLVAASWRAHARSVRQTDAYISIGRSDVRLLVNEMAELFDFLCGVHQSGQFYYIAEGWKL